MRTATKRIVGLLLLPLGLYNASSGAATGSVMVVAHVDTPALNEDTLQKIYLGKVVEVSGRPVIPVNLAKGNSLRKAFMELVMTQDDDKFVAYWTVRRYIGKGTPPREFATVEEQLEYVRTTPGALGYVDESANIKQGVRTLLKKP